MAKAQLTKNWTITPNVRVTYVSVVATMGWWLYQNKAAMVAAGWTVKFSSTGAVGPTNASDTTDRWLSAANCQVRGASAASPQTWIVLQNVDGVQAAFMFGGGSDDICRISMSPGGLFTLAATTTHQPTATDEIVLAVDATIITNSTSGDRVMSIGCTNESWWCATFRANLYCSVNGGGGGPIGIEKVDSACDTVVLARPYVGYKLSTPLYDGNLATYLSGGASIWAVGNTNFWGVAARVVTGGSSRIVKVCGGGYSIPTGSTASLNISMGAIMPPLQNGNQIMLLPLHWFGEPAANCYGYFGSPIDWWLSLGLNGSPVQGDMVAALDPGDTQATALRPNWLVVLGAGMIRPWRNAAVSMETA